jgi:phage gpG-like protein
LIDIQFEFPDWAGKLKRKEKQLQLFIAAQIQFNRGMLFDHEGAWNGRSRWPGLTFRNGQILSKRGTLRKSIAPFNAKGTPGPDGIVQFAGDTITVGTKLMFARMMNDGTAKMPGGVLRPVRAKALKIPIPEGKSAGPAAHKIQEKDNEKQMEKIWSKLAAHQDGSGKLEKKDLNSLKSRLRSLQKREIKGRVTGETKGDVKFIFVKSVKIPPRPFDDWNDADQKELDAALLNKVQEILNGSG